MSNTIDDLRAALFDTIRGVRDGSLPLEQAKAIAELSQTMINAAKVQVEYLRVVEGRKADFFEPVDDRPAQPPGRLAHDGQKPPNGVAAVTRHLMGR